MPSGHVGSEAAAAEASSRGAPTPGDVFRALTGFDPLPWQQRALNKMVDDGAGDWDGVNSAPTGMGKSMLPIIALVASAYVERPPRRYVYVVNRRIVVDQTYLIACEVAKRLRMPDLLAEPDRSTIVWFREMLRARMGLNNPHLSVECEQLLDVHLLRGGTNDRLLQIGSPAMPTIIVSTVDQAGSRLLMRGYGVSRRLWPIQGGLLAFDSIWFIDEAHTAKPLLTTLRRIQRAIMESRSGLSAGRPFQIVEASATHEKGKPFAPGDERERRIVEAPRNLSCELLDERPRKGDFGRRAAAFVSEGLEHEFVTRIAIVANTIADAREAFSAVGKAVKKHARNPRCFLLIGAVRKVERDAIFEEIGDDLHPDRVPTTPIIIVSTQTIETGPDFSFDWMLSELASLDAIIQRLGRVNRRGICRDVRSVVWGFPDQSSIYAAAPKATSEVLRSWGNGAIDASSLDLQVRLGIVDRDLLKACWSPSPLPEALVGARVRDLGRTWPQNRQETDVAWYLHGERSGEVEIVWRPGVEVLLGRSAHDERKELIAAYVSALPAEEGEALALSTRGARAFLRNNVKSDISDSVDGDPQEARSKNEREAIILRGDEAFVGGAQSLRSGDILFVPVSYGWYDRFGVAPGKKDLVPFNEDSSTRAIVFTETIPEVEEDEPDDAWYQRVVSTIHSRSDIAVAFKENLGEAAQIEVLDHPLNNLLGGNKRSIIKLIKRFGCNQYDDSGAVVTVMLEEHNVAVGACAKAYATALGLPNDITEALGVSGCLHDIGKAYIPFQVTRLGNNPSVSGRVLAKSKRGRYGRDQMRYRHEVASAKMAQAESAIVRHLIGTHHGYGRPAFPHHDDNDAAISFVQDGIERIGNAAQDLDAVGGWWREQFASLQVEWSPWGLAYLEAILRLADHRVSEKERQLNGKVSGHAL